MQYWMSSELQPHVFMDPSPELLSGGDSAGVPGTVGPPPPPVLLPPPPLPGVDDAL